MKHPSRLARLPQTALRVYVSIVLALWIAGCQSNRSTSSGPTPDPAAMEEAAARQSTVVGQPAPTFKLPDHNNKPFDLADQRGKWLVLYFYPKDDTPGCTCQATEFTDLLTRFHDLGARVVGVSADSWVMHQFFRTKYNLKIDLLSDTEHRVLSQYGAWVTARVGQSSVGRVIRSTFLIDPDGKIAYHWPEVIPEGHASRVRAKLESIKRNSQSVRDAR